MKILKYGYDESVTYDKKVNKVRGILINREGKALIVKYAGLYMLPGGKIEQGEKVEEALKREILEETGIEIKESDAEIFLEIETYNTGYYDRREQKEINRITNTKFYVVYTDKDIDEKKKKLTESEKEYNHSSEFLNLSVIPYLVETNQTDNKKRPNFDREILTALNEFKKYREEQTKKDEGERI